MHWRSKVKNKPAYGSKWNVAKEGKKCSLLPLPDIPTGKPFAAMFHGMTLLAFHVRLQCITHEKRPRKKKGNMTQVPRQGCSEQRYHNERYTFGRKDPWWATVTNKHKAKESPAQWMTKWPKGSLDLYIENAGASCPSLGCSIGFFALPPRASGWLSLLPKTH